MTHRALPWLFAAVALTLGAACVDPAETPTTTTDEGEVKGPPGEPTTEVANAAPILSPIGDRVVSLGESLEITMEAMDPDGDALTYTIVGQLPAGARFLKEERRFEWTPEVAGVVSYLTFVVTDGTAFDRETVRIEVSALDTNHPPALIQIGDQVAQVGTETVIQLSATDPDGNTLTYGISGDVPESATFDPHQGRFRWTPGPSDEGSQRQLTFSASDGELEDTEQVTLVVGGAGEGNPTPPVFDPVPAQQAVAGEPLSFPVTAAVPGQGAAEVAIYGGAPPGASLGAGLFTWTPVPEDIGLSWAVTFSAKATGLTAYLTVDIIVVSGSGATKCTDDPGEPNESLEEATPLAPGVLEASICDTTLVPVDSDFYVMDLAPGESLGATLIFDPLDGDLELEVVDEALTPLAISNSVGGEESVSWTSPGGGPVYLVVYGIAQAVFHAPYVLTVTVEDEGPCQDDAYEPNNTDLDPPDLPGAAQELTLCPGDTDWWSVLLFCGETVLFTLDAGGTGDLDMYLWDPDNPGDGLIASGATGALVEILEVTSIPHTGEYLLKVVGWPPGVGGGSYTVSPEYSGACFDKGVANNHDVATAWPLTDTTGILDDQRLCCDDDWYLLTIGDGQTALVDVQVTSPGGWAGVTVYAPGATQPIASGAPSASGSLVEVQASGDGVYVIQVDGAAGTDYDLDWLVD